MAQIFTAASAKRIVAAIIAAVCLIFFILTQIANIVAIAHLPSDLREAFVELSHISSGVAYSILAIGLCGVAYLVLDTWIRHGPQRRSEPLVVPHEEAARDWPIRELFRYIRPDLPLTSVRRTGNTTVDDLDERWEAVGACVLKQLSLGKLHATGRERRGGRRLQAAPIPSEFWRSARFTYWFLDHDGKEVLHAENTDGIQFSEIEVNGAEALTLWPNREISLFEAATRAYEQTRNSPISVAAEALTDAPDDILTWYCNMMARHQNGKGPLIKLWGIRRPSREKEEIYIAALSRYDFVVENGSIILQERNGGASYENLTVREREVINAIKDLASREV
jgi:hypothetical protein